MSSGENHFVEGEGPCDEENASQSDHKKQDSLTEAAPDEKRAKTLHEEPSETITPAELIADDNNTPVVNSATECLPNPGESIVNENDQDKNGNTETPKENTVTLAPRDAASNSTELGETINLKVAYNKTIYETVISKSQTVQDLKYAVQVSSAAWCDSRSLKDFLKNVTNMDIYCWCAL